MMLTGDGTIRPDDARSIEAGDARMIDGRYIVFCERKVYGKDETVSVPLSARHVGIGLDAPNACAADIIRAYDTYLELVDFTQRNDASESLDVYAQFLKMLFAMISNAPLVDSDTMELCSAIMGCYCVASAYSSGSLDALGDKGKTCAYDVVSKSVNVAYAIRRGLNEMSDIVDVIDGKVISWTCYVGGMLDRFVDVTPKVMKRYLLGE